MLGHRTMVQMHFVLHSQPHMGHWSSHNLQRVNDDAVAG